MTVAFHLRRVPLLVTIALILSAVGATPASAAETEVDTVISVAKEQLGDRWVWGATGPDKFDCSGFVYYSFRESALLDRISGKRRTVRGYWDWFAARGLASRTNGQPGDLVVWGKAKHMGIYLGDGWAISALTSGVAIHRLDKINLAFKTFLHVPLER